MEQELAIKDDFYFTWVMRVAAVVAGAATLYALLRILLAFGDLINRSKVEVSIKDKSNDGNTEECIMMHVPQASTMTSDKGYVTGPNGHQGLKDGFQDADADDSSRPTEEPSIDAATKPNREADWVKVGTKSTDGDDQSLHDHDDQGHRGLSTAQLRKAFKPMFTLMMEETSNHKIKSIIRDVWNTDVLTFVGLLHHLPNYGGKRSDMDKVTRVQRDTA